MIKALNEDANYFNQNVACVITMVISKTLANNNYDLWKIYSLNENPYQGYNNIQ